MGAISLLAVSIWWIQILISRSRPPTTIADIAYDNIKRGRNVDYRVFVEENGELVPYLVLTADYGGNVLLLREFLLDEFRPFNPSRHGERLWAWQDYGAYYPDSDIDNFLNTEFKNTLGDTVIYAMVASDIEVTAKESMGRAGRESRIITRYVFLLSLRELGHRDSTIAVPLGEALRYFRGYHIGRVATLSNGMATPYWTRTSNNWETYLVFAVSINFVDSDTADILIGVRPAFCLDRTTSITTHTCITSGEVIFILDNDDLQ